MTTIKQKPILWLVFVLLQGPALFGQKPDSLRNIEIDQITITSYRFPGQELKHLDAIHQTYITSGKKNEVILVQDLPFNAAEKTGRQLFAKIPGSFIYDMDGSGNQINVATRGLDPHRSWEYNIRQNGIMTNSDIYGYPASHYSPPMEAIHRIEVLRGTSSLLYGSQFGGMINYITKAPDTTKAITIESINTAGSFGLLSSFNSVGGKAGKMTYCGYYQSRKSSGYRNNSLSDSESQFASLQYAFTPSLTARAEMGRSTYLYQIPGPLTDKQFGENARQSSRTRNYFSPDIYVPSITLDWKMSKNTRVNWISSAVLGSRSSVQFVGFADVEDLVDSLTLRYKPRQVDIDGFKSYASEMRVLQDYALGSVNATLVGGIRYTHNDLHRRQQGKGSTGTDYDLAISESGFGRDIHFKTQNVAIFAENLFKISKKFHMTLGLRTEQGQSKMTGRIAYLPNEKVPLTIQHRYWLAGISSEYQIGKAHKIYGGWSQAYRPVVFADIIPATILEKTDPSLKDAFGYNTELGFKGKFGTIWTYDLTFFEIRYNNRIGSLIQEDVHQGVYVWKTNIGDSRTRGAELYLEALLYSDEQTRLSIFTASSYFDGVYLNGTIRNGAENTSLKGNKLETVPMWISRSAFQAGYRKFSSIFQFSYVGKSFSDAVNTEIPSSNGAKGPVPSYGVWDLNILYRLNQNFQVKIGCNNMLDKSYFTKRPAGYPGQGVWSSDGRSFVVTVSYKM
ncbi:MAG: TonB-dependent receptor [Saprospiraceae bacterium]|nr:TonB-dependent receptor [Saprospiraceae bacterium]